MRMEEDETSRSAAFRASRLAKHKALDALLKTQLLLTRFDQHTQARWDVVKKVADAGYMQHSRAMAASVQVLQDRVDANNKALAKHKTPLSDPSTAQHTTTSTLQLQELQQHQPALDTSAQPEPHLHQQEHAQAGSSSSSLASTSSSSSNPQDACSKRPAAPPPLPPLPGQLSPLQPVRTKPAGQALPGTAVLARQAGAQQGQMPRPAPPPPSGPPPPHAWCAGASAEPRTEENGRKHAATAAAATQGGPAGGSRPAPPPPPGPPPPHPFSTNSKAVAQQQQKDKAGPKPAPPPPPLPPGGFGPGCKPLPNSSTTQGPNPSSPAAAASQVGNSGPARTPPPPPPLPPGGFRTPPRPKTAPGGCRSGGPGPHPGINALAAAAAAAAGARRAQQDGQEPSTPKGALLSHNSFSSMASPHSAEAGASTCSKLKRLHVDPVPKHRMMDGSFWNTTGDLVKPFQAEFEYALRCMFSSTSTNGRRATDGGGGAVDGAAADEAAGRVIKVIADKRALQVEVCIKRLRMDAPALAAALNRIDTERLKQDDLPQIRSMLPKPDELSLVHAAKKKALKEHSAKLAAMAAVGGSSARMRGSSSSSSDSLGEGVPPPPRLGVVEAAFEALGGVQMLMAKMRACEFKYDIETVSAQVDDFGADLSASLCAFRSCGQLQYLLAFVRDVANTMNASAVQGGTAVEGLKLDSLSRLQSTRMAGATDLNLLHYIVAHLSSLMPGVLELDATREVFKAVTKRGTFDTVLTRVRGLREMHKRISNDLTKAREHLRRTSPKQAGHGSCGKDGSSGGGSVASPPAAGPGGSSSSSGPAAAPPPPAAAAAAAASEPSEGGDGGPRSPATPAAATAAGPDGDAAAEQHVYIDRLAQLLDSSGSKIDSMDAKMQGVIQQFRWTAEFFCEDVNVGWKQQPAAFITHFADLLEALEATKKDTARVAKVNKILGQFFEERRQQEEAAAAAAAAAAQAGVELGWPEDDERQHQQLFPALHQRLLLDHAGADAYSDSGFEGEQQQGGSVEGHTEDHDDEVLRLTRTNSWVIGVAHLARSLQFCSPSGSDEEGSEAGSCVVEGHAGVDVGVCVRGLPTGHSVGEEAPLQQQQQQQEHSGDRPMRGDGIDNASQPKQQQPGAATAAAAAAAGLQQQQELSLPVTHWQPDMLAGVWGSCLSVASGATPNTGSGCSSNRSSADAIGTQQHCQ